MLFKYYKYYQFITKNYNNEKAQNKSINLFTDWIKAFKILIFDLKSKIQTKLILRIVI